MSNWTKDPDATLDYSVDWSAWLGTDTISTSTWIITAGVTKVTDTHTDTGTTVWLSGGAVGSVYELVNRITTAGGRIEDRTNRLRIRQR